VEIPSTIWCIFSIISSTQIDPGDSCLRLHALRHCESPPSSLAFRPHPSHSLHHNSSLHPAFALEIHVVRRERTQTPLSVIALAAGPGVALSPPFHPVRAVEWVEAVQIRVAAARMPST
jgi:hypothetical protein